MIFLKTATMSRSTFSFDDIDDYHTTVSGGFETEANGMEAFAPTSGSPDGKSMAGLDPPPHMAPGSNAKKSKDDDDDEVEEKEETMQESGGRGPFSVDWEAAAKGRMSQGLQEYEENVKALFDAMSAFVRESKAIHAEWSDILQVERAESQRLDELEPTVLLATANFPGDHDDSSNAHS